MNRPGFHSDLTFPSRLLAVFQEELRMPTGPEWNVVFSDRTAS